jgi:hypothetical protein
MFLAMDETTGRARIVALAVTLASLALYAATAAPDLALVDSAELVLAAASGGVAHPPGVPLYLLIGRVFAELPLGSVPRAMNLMSSFFTALAAGALVLAGERLLAYGGIARAARLPAAAAGALAFATAYNPWTWAGVAEVYALNVALLGGAWWATWTAAVRLSASPPREAWGPITAAAVLGALGLANHHATAAIVLAVLFAVAVLVRPRLLRSRRFWLTGALAVAGSLALYLYLFVAARNDPALNWGGIDSFHQLWRHLTGTQYAQQVGTPLEESLRVAGEMSRTLVLGAGIPAALLAGLALGVLGARAVRRRGPRAVRDASTRARVVLAGLAGLIALNVVLSMNYVAGPEDRMAYDLPATTAWCLLAALGAGVLAEATARRSRALGAATAAGLVLAPVAVNVVRNLPLCDLHDERVARTYVEEVLGPLPEGAVVLTAEWNLYAPYLWMRHEEGWRRDLQVVDVLMLRRHWYLEYLEREMPGLVAAAPDEWERFKDEIFRFDFGEPYDQANMQAIYDRLILAWLRSGARAGGGFTDWAAGDHPQELSWMRQAALVPDGLLLRAPVFPGAGGEVPLLLPKSRENLLYLRERLTEASLAGDRTTLVPRHDPYWKVWRTYANAVEASLVLAYRAGPAEFADRGEAYREWFPDAGGAIERVLARVRAGR